MEKSSPATCLPSLWKLLLLPVFLQVVASCPIQCTCSRLPRNKLLSSLFLGNASLSNTSVEQESVVCMDQSLSSLPDDIPRQAVFLDLSKNNIVIIGNQFQNLTKLQTLVFSQNKITSLENGEFGNMSQLHDLIITENSISIIHPETFQNLGSVENLDLARNQLEILDSGTFHGLTRLKQLNLSHNHITEIKHQTLNHLENLQILDLSYNSLTRLNANNLAGSPELKILNLSHNSISYILAETFQFLHRLEVLDLSHNILQSTSDFVFSGLKALSTLDLSNNILTYISEMTFENVSNLTSLHLDSNSLSQIDIPVFVPLHKLKFLSMSQMPYLSDLSYDTFSGLDNLATLDLSQNPLLSFINPHLFSTLPKLETIDLHGNNISYLSAITFHRNDNLTHLNVTNNPLLCSCDIAWMVNYGNDSIMCAISDGDLVPISHVNNETFPCSNLVHNERNISTFYLKLGSSARIVCDVSLDPMTIVLWTTPQKEILIYHAFHPDAIKHHPDPDDIDFEPDWISDTWYHSEMIYRSDRVVLLSDGSLFIDYILRSDTGHYKCEVRNAYDTVSTNVTIWLDYSSLNKIKIWSLMIGVCCAFSFFVLIVAYTMIRACTIRIINKRRREAIHQLLENLDVYKRNQITRIRDQYSTQLGRVSDHYHNQLERLRSNYTMQMGRVKRGCSYQVDRVRDNYNTKAGRLKDYSSHQIDQLRTGYNNQLLRIRDYGSLQFDRLRETCKQQQMNVMKLMETMNIENCKGIIEAECIRTESMIFEPEFVNDDDIQGLSLIGSESDYITATDSEDSKSSNSQTQDIDMGNPLEVTCLEKDGIFEPLNFMSGDFESDKDTDEEPVTLEFDLGEMTLETVI